MAYFQRLRQMLRPAPDPAGAFEKPALWPRNVPGPSKPIRPARADLESIGREATSSPAETPTSEPAHLAPPASKAPPTPQPPSLAARTPGPTATPVSPDRLAPGAREGFTPVETSESLSPPSGIEAEPPRSMPGATAPAPERHTEKSRPIPTEVLTSRPEGKGRPIAQSAPRDRTDSPTEQEVHSRTEAPRPGESRVPAATPEPWRAALERVRRWVSQPAEPEPRDARRRLTAVRPAEDATRPEPPRPDPSPWVEDRTPTAGAAELRSEHVELSIGSISVTIEGEGPRTAISAPRPRPAATSRRDGSTRGRHLQFQRDYMRD
jgi:hypothetical protein